MKEFEFYIPTKVVFGRGAERRVPELLREQGATKVLLHYGGNSVLKYGLLEKLKNLLDEAGIEYVALGGVVPNPHLEKVYEGIALCKKEGVDFILAVGGGSVIDSAKAIAYGIANEGDVWDIYEGKTVPVASVPIGAVLTIAAAGSEMSNSSVITNESIGSKRGANHEISRCRFAVMNPELTFTLPPFQTACGCVDIVMHTLERWFSTGSTMEITDSLAAGLIRTVLKESAVLRDEPNNYEARAGVMWAGSLSHNGLTGCGADNSDWATHKLGMEFSAAYDIAHGATLSALWCSWAKYVSAGAPERFAKLGRDVFDIDTADEDRAAAKCIKAMESFFRAEKMPASIGELGISVDAEKIRELAEKCAAKTGGTIGQFKKLDVDDIEKIYLAAM